MNAATEAGIADFHDPLTELPNRALFNDRLEHGLELAQRNGWFLAVMFMDLDGFKGINDSYGHEAGDSVLRTIAGRLRDGTRGGDSVCRYGGDEFVYMLQEVRDEQSVALIAQKILESIQAPCEVRVGGRDIHPSIKASIGISIFPRHGTAAADLVRRADEAMCEAKQARSGCSFAR